MKQRSDSKKRIAFPIQLFEGPDSAVATPREIHIIPTGQWEHWSGYEFEITPQTVAQIVANFNSGVLKDIPITAGHDGMDGESPAVGWFTALIDHGVNGLYGEVEWNDYGRQLLAGKMFKYFSAEIDFEYHSAENDKDYGVVLTGGALTNHPFFKQLDMDPSLGFSEEQRKSAVMMFSVPSIMKQLNTQSMDLNEILAKKAADLTDEEKAFVVEHKDELNDEQTTEFASVVGETAPAETDEEKAAREATELGDANEAAGLNRDGSAKVNASDKNRKTVTLSASEHAALTAKADAGQKAFDKLALSERKEVARKMTFSESNKDGRFLPKQQEALVGFLATLSEKQQDQFTNLVNNMPKTQLFGEIGHGSNAGEDVAKELDTAVKLSIKASEGKLTYSAALKQVAKENPELMTRYDAALSENQ